MDSGHVLVKFKADYSDEFYVYGFKIWPKENWEAFVSALDNVKYDYEWYFGTNESIEFYSKEDVLKKMTVFDLTVEEKATLNKFFDEDWGHFPRFNFEDEDEDED